VLLKRSDESIICQKHQRDAKQCLQEMQSDLIYENTLDRGTYRLTIVRTAPYRGQLTLTRGESTVLEREVGIMYDAPFGPDAEDVRAWESLAIEAADKDYRRRGEVPPA
jgi:hypothetical protein